MLVGELAQLLAALHRAVVVDDLGDHPGRLETGEPGQVDRGLGVPGTHQHAALGVAQREHVPGLDELERPRSPSRSASRTVCERSAAEMPVLMPSRASTETVYAVRIRSRLCGVISGIPSRSSVGAVTGTQITPEE